MVWKNLSVEELLLRCSVFPVSQMVEGVALVDDRSGVTFDVELCIPWDTPEAVVDINSVEVVMLGSLLDKVGLFRPAKGCIRQSDSTGARQSQCPVSGPRCTWFGPEFPQRHDSGYGRRA